MKNKLITAISITVLLLFFATPLLAQPRVPAAPVDGGLSLLAAAGIGYGMKKIRKRRKKQQDIN
jgi:hypothetical protein